MSNYSTLKAAISDVVKTNGNNAITGALLQQSLLSIIDALGVAGFIYKGFAFPSTDPGTPDQNVYYFASTPGTYSNFGGVILGAGIHILATNNGGSTWLSGTLSTNENSSFVLTYETGGYAKIEDEKLKFKKLYLVNSRQKQICALTDGTHGVNDDNEISMTAGHIIYILGSEYDTGTAQIRDGNIATSPAATAIITLGVYSPLPVYGGLLSFVELGAKVENVVSAISGIMDPSLFTQSGYITSAGEEAANDDCKRTDFIAVTPGQKFTYSGWIDTSGACIAGYDSNKDFVGVLLSGTGQSIIRHDVQITIPDGISFIRSCSAFGITIGGELINGSLYTTIGDIISRMLQSQTNALEFPDLTGKKVVFFGDSITAAGIYESEFQSLTGCVAYNRGVGGTTFAQISQSLLWNESLADRVDLAAQEGTSASNRGLPSNPDLIFVFAGINDWGRIAKNNETPVPAGGGSYQPADYITGERFGDMNVEDKTTFCGAVRYVLRRLKTKYPTTPIVAILPLHTYSPDQYPLWSELKYGTPGTESSDWTIQKSTDDDKTLYDYRNAIRTIANQFGIPVIDTFEMGITPILATDKAAYYNEGLHPNTAGYHLLGNFIYKQLPKEFLLKSV